jgi:hypothetical protein
MFQPIRSTNCENYRQVFYNVEIIQWYDKTQLKLIKQ